MTDKVLGASPSSHAPAEEHVNEEAGTTAGIPETGVTDQTPETSGESQSVAQVTSLSKQTSDSSLSDDSEETEEQDEEEEEGIPVSGKYVTSGTQTPYSKRYQSHQRASSLKDVFIALRIQYEYVPSICLHLIIM